MPTPAAELLQQPSGTLACLIDAHGEENPQHRALVTDREVLCYGELRERVRAVAGALHAAGVAPGDVVALCASVTSLHYATAFIAILWAGAVVAPLAPSVTADSLHGMLKDCGAKLLFLDRPVAAALAAQGLATDVAQVLLDAPDGATEFDAFFARATPMTAPVAVDAEQAFNIIYSSGTTGKPKGIVQPHRFRWEQFRRGTYTREAVTMVSTPLYSNTTLVSFLPTLAAGGQVVLMAKFDAAEFLRLAEKHRATHAMLVPVQYRRLMLHPGFDDADLSSFQMKFSTSAPFAAELKREVLRRWPGGLIEFYGMTEGGGSCMLVAHEHPDKLATVGQPMPGHDVRLIDEDGVEVARGGIGEVVGRSPSIMKGYHGQPDKTREAEWYSPQGERFIRTGDIGRFDDDGFLTLLDRKKDMIISGGFNIYPSDLEAQLIQHPAVFDAAVVGVPSQAWGETPVAAVVLRAEQAIDAETLRAWVNGRLGKTQCLAAVQFVEALPRSAIGKVLKRELRDRFGSL